MRASPKKGTGRQALLQFLAFLGGALGCLLALTVHGHSTGTSTLQSFAEAAYALRVTPRTIACAMGFALVLGGGGRPAAGPAGRPAAHRRRRSRGLSQRAELG